MRRRELGHSTVELLLLLVPVELQALGRQLRRRQLGLGGLALFLQVRGQRRLAVVLLLPGDGRAVLGPLGLHGLQNARTLLLDLVRGLLGNVGARHRRGVLVAVGLVLLRDAAVRAEHSIERVVLGGAGRHVEVVGLRVAAA